MAERRPSRTSWVVGGAAISAIAAIAFFWVHREPAATIAAPSVSVASVTTQPAVTAVESATAPPAVTAAPLDAPVADDEPPPPWMIDEDAGNPEIKPELAQTPEWKIGKTQRILDVVGRRAARTEKEIESLDRQGKKSEADEKRVLLSRLRKRIDAMKKDIAGYEAQITSDGGVLPAHGFAPDGAPLL